MVLEIWRVLDNEGLWIVITKKTPLIWFSPFIAVIKEQKFDAETMNNYWFYVFKK